MDEIEKSNTEDLSPISIIMTDVGKKVFANINFTKYPESEIVNIIEYESMLRLSPLEKFNSSCYISIINLYKSQDDLEKKNALGAFILYLNEADCGRALRRLNYENFDEDADEEVMAICDQVAQKYLDTMLIAMRPLGYSDLVSSEARSHKNNVLDGVPFDYNETLMYSTSFYAWKEKQIVVELTIAPIK